MKKLVKLEFNLIVEVADDATRDEIIEQVVADLVEAAEEDVEKNNLISISDYKDDGDKKDKRALELLRLREELKEVNEQMDAIVEAGGKIHQTDPLLIKSKRLRGRIGVLSGKRFEGGGEIRTLRQILFNK